MGVHFPNTAGVRSPHEANRLVRYRRYYRDFSGEAEEVRRAREIDALPLVEWRGKHGTKPPQWLRTIRCHGVTGKGPHDCNVPESLLWALMTLREFHCVYHPKEQQPDRLCALLNQPGRKR